MTKKAEDLEVVETQAIVVAEKKALEPEALIAQAIDKGTPVETMERLLAMRTQLKQEYAREEFYKALVKFQKEIPAIVKDKVVLDKSGKTRYSYAPLDSIVRQVKDVLEANGFSYTLKTTQANGLMTVTCEAHHVAGHTEQTDVTVPVGSEYMTSQQQVGAALTFAKRYAFSNAFGVLTTDEDTDANDTEDKKPEPKPEPKPTGASKDTATQAQLRRMVVGETATLDVNGKASFFKGLLIAANIPNGKSLITDLDAGECARVAAVIEELRKNKAEAKK